MKNDWRLSYDAAGIYPGADLPFGTVRSGYVFLSMPVVGSPDIASRDVVRARADGRQFSRDDRDGPTISFDVEESGEGEDAGRVLNEALALAWRADAVRLSPGKVAKLTASSGRCAFGRPRRRSSMDDRSHVGRYTTALDFQAADDLWYGDEESASVRLIPPASGGFRAPFVAPFTTTGSADRSQLIRVGGTVPTWGVHEITGPISRPVLEITGLFRFEYDITLAYDDVLRIDTRPWAQSVTLLTAGVDRGSRSGTATRRSTRLDAARLPAGEHELILRGTSASGTPAATTTWRNAFPTW